MQLKHLASVIVLASLTACGGGGGGAPAGENKAKSSVDTFETMSSPLTELSFTTGQYGKGLTISRKNYQVRENTWQETKGFEHLEGTNWVLYQSGNKKFFFTKEGTLYEVTDNDVISAIKSTEDNGVFKSIKSIPSSAKTKYLITSTKDLSDVKIVDFILGEDQITDDLIDSEEKVNWFKGFGDKAFLQGAKAYILQEKHIEKQYIVTSYQNRLQNKTLNDLEQGKTYTVGDLTFSLAPNNVINLYGMDNSGSTSSSPKLTGKYTVLTPKDNVTIYEFPSQYLGEKNALISDGSDVFSAEFKNVNSEIPFIVLNAKAMTDVYELLSNGDDDHKLPKPLTSFNK